MASTIKIDFGLGYEDYEGFQDGLKIEECLHNGLDVASNEAKVSIVNNPILITKLNEIEKR
jgi:hypothetical protein